MLGTSADGSSRSRLSAQTFGLSGNGGNIEINTPQLLVSEEGRINVSTRRSGNGGSIIINASELVQLIDGAFRSVTRRSGNGGDIIITTPQFLLTDNSDISVDTRGAGRGGSIIINASESVQLLRSSADDGFFSSLFAGTRRSGRGGNVEINTSQLLVSGEAGISVSTIDEGKGGSIIINASEIQLNGITSALTASSEGTGTAGDVTITTEQFLVSEGGTVSVSAPLGQAGNLTINS